MKSFWTLLPLIIFLVGCSTYIRDEEAAALVSRQPLETQDRVVNALYQHQRISAATKDQLLNAVANAKEEQKLIAQMSPSERAHYNLQKQQLLAQQESNRLQSVGIQQAAALNALQTAQANIQQNNLMMQNTANSFPTYTHTTPVYVAPKPPAPAPTFSAPYRPPVNFGR